MPTANLHMHLGRALTARQRCIHAPASAQSSAQSSTVLRVTSTISDPDSAKQPESLCLFPRLISPPSLIDDIPQESNLCVGTKSSLHVSHHHHHFTFPVVLLGDLTVYCDYRYLQVRCIIRLSTSSAPTAAFRPDLPTYLLPLLLTITSLPTEAMSLSDSFAIPDLSVSDLDDVDSLPSTTTESFESDDEDYNAQKEWEQSLEQLQLLLTMILIPFAGKYFGRKFAYWSWARYMEWTHNVEINWTNKKAFKAAGAVEAAATL
ncbi:hypothetical protein O1611_g5182 [Lasiodiplodia mahajangana]|uniref:Uncharacterized protein n=1 Tax=Lasiodiplodia mahajangana TaxID=1108764 RepID=A0ACC2JMN0_9PEZI|nr:hypothetical protein O1611_g5182 [Lasiodiplodia mahajangana]